ncbi:hypothetical protein Tco_1387361, partial [Tanacetum coccineum]
GQGHAEYAGLDDVVGDNRQEDVDFFRPNSSSLLDYSYAAVWDMSFQVVAAMFEKLGHFSCLIRSLLALKLTIVGVPAHQVPLLLGLTASRAEPQLQHPSTGRALFMSLKGVGVDERWLKATTLVVLRSDERAERQNEERKDVEMKKLRQKLTCKAKPMPSFYRIQRASKTTSESNRINP